MNGPDTTYRCSLLAGKCDLRQLGVTKAVLQLWLGRTSHYEYSLWCCGPLLLLHLFQSRCKDDVIQGIQLLNLLNMARLKLIVCQPSLPQPWQLLRGLHPWEPLDQEKWGVMVQIISKVHNKALLEVLHSGFGDNLKEWCMQRIVVDDRIKVVYPINRRHKHPSHGIVAACLLCSQATKFKPADKK